MFANNLLLVGGLEKLAEIYNLDNGNRMKLLYYKIALEFLRMDILVPFYQVHNILKNTSLQVEQMAELLYGIMTRA